MEQVQEAILAATAAGDTVQVAELHRAKLQLGKDLANISGGEKISPKTPTS